jgi:hypothetical protein
MLFRIMIIGGSNVNCREAEKPESWRILAQDENLADRDD